MPDSPDDQLVGNHSDLEQLDALTDDERRQLTRYRSRTRGFKQRSDEFLAQADQSGGQIDAPAAHAMLAHWNAAWKELRDWHHMLNGARVTADAANDRNPVSRVLDHEEHAIANLGTRLTAHL